MLNRCILCKSEEESTCETTSLWDFLFSFGTTWVDPSLVRETILGWNRSFVDKGRERHRDLRHSVCFGLFSAREIIDILKMPSKQFRH